MRDRGMTGYVVPRCECGHPEGDHLSNGAGFPHPAQAGRCMSPACPCKRFVEANQKAAAA